MIELDTNVLVRYLIQDDPAQTPLATDLIESLTADAGLCLPARAGRNRLGARDVLRRRCRVDRPGGGNAIAVETLRVDEADVVWRALRQFKQVGGDMADALGGAALARRAGCETVYSFDRGAAKRCDMTPLR